MAGWRAGTGSGWPPGTGRRRRRCGRGVRLLRRGEARLRRREREASGIGHRCRTGRRGALGGAGVPARQGAVGAEAGRQRPYVVEDLDDLVLDRRVGQQLDSRQDRLARPGGRLEPCFGVGVQQRGQHLPQRLGNALRGVRDAVLLEAPDQRLGVRLGAGDQVERDQADREEVRGEVRLGTQHLFGCEVTGRPHHVVGLGEPGLALAHRDAEVGQPQMRPAGAGGLQQDVRRFDVAVHHALRVHRRQTGQQLIQQGAHEPRRQRAVVTDQMRQRSAVDQVHGEKDVVVVGGPARRGEHMRMVDAQRLFAYEAQQCVRVALLQHLGRDIATAPVVPGAPDRAHTASADRIDQLVPSGEDLTHCAPFAFLAPRLRCGASRYPWCAS